MKLLKPSSCSGVFGEKSMDLEPCHGFSPCIMCIQYIGACSVYRGDTMSTSGGYLEYTGGCSVHRRDIMIH